MSKLSAKGLDKLTAGLRARQSLDPVKEVVKRHTANMQGETARLAPVRTGALRRGIKLEITDNGMTGIVGGTVGYDPYQEFGTRFMAGTPHFRPAFNKELPLFKADLKNLMK